MNHHFDNVPEAKRQAIIQICIEEFTANGYENTSTNAIVKKAGISKGILFHYFENKKNLYLYLIDHVIDSGIEKFNQANDSLAPSPTTDLFERILERSMLKLKMAYEDPLLYKFLMKAFSNIPTDLKPDLEARYQKIYNENMPLAFAGLDFSKLRKGVSPEKAIKLLLLVSEALYNKYLNLLKDREDLGFSELENIIAESKEYLEILKHGIYGSVE